MKPIRICFAIPTLDVGGSEKILISLLKNLSKDFLPLVWIWQKKGALIKELEELKIPYFFSPINRKVIKILKKEKIDIFDSWSYATPFWDILIARRAGIKKIVHTRHSLNFWWQKRYIVDAFFMKKIVNQFIAVSEIIKKNMTGREKIDPYLIKVIPNFLEIPGSIDPSSLRQKLKLPKDRTIIGNISNFHHAKGIFDFIKLAQILQNENLFFVLVGRGMLENKIKIKIKELKLENNFYILNNINNYQDFIPACDIIVSNSFSEGFGLTILEAWAYKKPVIFTHSGGPEEVINNGVNGFLIPKHQPQGMAEKILLLKNNKKLAQKLAQNGYQKLKIDYSPQKVIRYYENMYHNLIFDLNRLDNNCDNLKNNV